MKQRETDENDDVNEVVINFQELDQGEIVCLYIDADIQLPERFHPIRVLEGMTMLVPDPQGIAPDSLFPKIDKDYFLHDLEIKDSGGKIFRYREHDYEVLYVSPRLEVIAMQEAQIVPSAALARF